MSELQSFATLFKKQQQLLLLVSADQCRDNFLSLLQQVVEESENLNETLLLEVILLKTKKELKHLVRTYQAVCTAQANSAYQASLALLPKHSNDVYSPKIH